MRYALTRRDGGGTRRELEVASLAIGRGPGAGLVLEESGIDPLHAELKASLRVEVVSA